MSNWSLVCHVETAEGGSVVAITEDGGRFSSKTLSVASGSGKDLALKPLFFGVVGDQMIVMDPEARSLGLRRALESDAFPSYAYRDDVNQHVWFMNDGDKKTGNDVLHCGENGSTVMVVRQTDNKNKPAELVDVICVGRGHHVTTFTEPSDAQPDMPKRAFVSNLLDGSISVLGNDPADKKTYLKVFDTINLAEADKEDSGQQAIPNNAFPHGKVYSAVTGMIYSLNNGYGTVAVIDPIKNEIVDRINLKKSSNLLLAPNGKFLIGKGADRKSDSEHVVGVLTVIDAVSREVTEVIEIPDLYPSVYRFSPDGAKLYVTSAATGKDVQKENLSIDTVSIYDTSALPAISLSKVVKVGVADCGRRPIAFYAPEGKARYVFIPNPTDGTVTVLDGDSDEVLATVDTGTANAKDVNFSFWDGGDVFGA